MNKCYVNERYFCWLCDLMFNERYEAERSYNHILRHLHETEFMYTLSMDANRADDGKSLRYRFGRDCHLNDATVASCLDDRPCSVFEMMAALALRCEETIMSDIAEGDRTGVWFWEMVKNLGLGSMDDEHYDRKTVDKYLTRFMNHKYSKNGKGGLFSVHRCSRDLRTVEIWYQMCWYLNEKEGGIRNG